MMKKSRGKREERWVVVIVISIGWYFGKSWGMMKGKWGFSCEWWNVILGSG